MLLRMLKFGLQPARQHASRVPAAAAMYVNGATSDGCRQRNKLLMALIKDYEAVCDIWMARPPFRVLYEFLEPFPQLLRDGEAEAQDGDPD